MNARKHHLAVACLLAAIALSPFGILLAQVPGPVVAPGAGNFGPPFTVQGGHLSIGAASPPALSSCGTGPTVVGVDSTFSFTAQSTACTATFAKPWNATPICDANTVGATANPAFTASPSALTFSGLTAGNTYNVMCFGQPGG